MTDSDINHLLTTVTHSSEIFNNNISTLRDREDEDLITKDGSWLNKLFMILTLFCFAGNFFMIFKYDKYWEQILVYKPKDYEIPKLSDSKYLLMTLPIIIIGKIIFENYFSQKMYDFLSKTYKNPMDEEMFKLGLVYKKKLASNLFKVTYHVTIVVIGHFILKDMKFFPQELLGNGNILNMFKEGVPGYLFFEKPVNFDAYYITGLSFVIVELIWLLFIYEFQSDFYIMLLLHSLSISMIIFSYLTNLSQIGIIVFYLHDLTDIFVYIVRIVIYSDYSDCIKVTPCVLLLVSFIFYRIYLFGKLILIVYLDINDWNPYSTILWYFLCVLLIIHIYWVSLIVKRFMFFKIEDVGKIKKK
jgi:hypothetical protein